MESIIKYLKQYQPQIYTKSESVSSRSSVQYISLYIVYKGELMNITHLAGELMKTKTAHNNGFYGLKYGGWGYSKSFQAVYSLGRALWPDGYKCTGEKCRSNDHTNGLADRTKGKHHHNDGGYFFGSERQI